MKVSQRNIFVATGRGCDAVGRVVAFDTRDPRFESSHWHKFKWTTNCIEKTKITKQRPVMAHKNISVTEHIREISKSQQ